MSDESTERLNAVEGEVIDPPKEIAIAFGSGPFSPEEREQVVRWIKAGLSRNEIKRRTGRGGATITRIAQDNELTFSPAEMMRPALEAQGLNMRARRLALAEKLLEKAHRLTEELDKPGMLYFPDYKNSAAIRVKIKRLQPDQVRNLMTAIGIAVDKVAELERLDTPQEGKTAILALVDNLRLNVAKEIHNDAPASE